jgi:hypothetical protein
MAAVVVVIIGCRRTDHAQPVMHDPFVAVIHHRFRQPFPEGHHHRWIKWSRVLEGFQADEKLEIRIHLDLLNQFFIREHQAVLDDQRPSAIQNGFAGAPKPLQNWAA